MKIIIQAGGKGARMQELTYNKPKALISVNNLPMIMHLFKLFSEHEFIIIGDYKFDVLQSYLSTFASQYNYNLIKAQGDGTISGIKDALSFIPDSEPFIISWCDLVLPEDFKLPADLSCNYIGISKEYTCRWSFIDNVCVKEPSSENGIAGFFIFKDKSQLKDVPEEGSFVGKYLSNKGLNFKRLDLFHSKEFGTLEAYLSNKTEAVCRPFNSVEFDIMNNLVVKKGITAEGERIGQDEIAWYKKVQDLGYESIPQIIDFTPLTMRIIDGHNVSNLKSLSVDQKKSILSKIITNLRALHSLKNPIPSSDDCVKDVLLTKTLSRLNTVKNLIPFAKHPIITINNKQCKNIFFHLDELEDLIAKYMPSEFKLIHGDCTFSNMMYVNQHDQIILIDPRGSFGQTKYYGDEYYDWAKLYYSVVGNYDQFNRKNFALQINSDHVNLQIDSNNWEDLENYFFELLPNVSREKIKLIHCIIWLSLTTYVFDNYDSICAAFYNGTMYFDEISQSYKADKKTLSDVV